MLLSELIDGLRKKVGPIRRTDAVYLINDAMAELAVKTGLTRTDCIRNDSNILTREPVRIISVDRGWRFSNVTYQYIPKFIQSDFEVPELPAWCHGAIITYAVNLYCNYIDQAA